MCSKQISNQILDSLDWYAVSLICLGLTAGSREQSEEYRIPHGDWFEVVSSPHYLAKVYPMN